jgi:hypothetical protein
MKSLKDEEIIEQNMVGSTHQGEPVEDDDGCCPGCYDDSEEYYKRLMSVKMPEGMSLEIRRGNEGPQHDPYGWTVYDVRMPDGTRVMYRDAILSECLNIIRPDETISWNTGTTQCTARSRTSAMPSWLRVGTPAREPLAFVPAAVRRAGQGLVRGDQDLGRPPSDR